MFCGVQQTTKNPDITTGVQFFLSTGFTVGGGTGLELFQSWRRVTTFLTGHQRGLFEFRCIAKDDIYLCVCRELDAQDYRGRQNTIEHLFYLKRLRVPL